MTVPLQAVPVAVRFQRKLRAVAFVDVAGYSRLMAADESGTHARVNALFAQAVAPAVAAHGGQTIERAGDGLLLLFESSTDAVRCALAVQREAQRQQAGAEPAQALLLRIGVNVGDIIVDGAEIAGDDVNIAVRLQSIARPGAICISDAVRGQLHDDLGTAFVDCGNVELKNIGRPVRAFQTLPAGSPARTGGRRAALRLQRLRVPLAALALLTAAGLAAVVATRIVPSHAPAAASADPPPMSVAVAAFVPRAADDAALAAAATETVTIGLMTTSWLAATTLRAQLAPAGAEASDIAAAGRSLHVRYVVGGRVGQASGKPLIDAMLVDTATGLVAWNARVGGDAGSSDPPDPALSIVVLLRDAIYWAESQRLVRTGAKPSTPMEYKMLGDRATGIRFVVLDAERKARTSYQKALQLDPDFVPAMIAMAYTLVAELDLEPAADRDAVTRRIDQLSKRAVSVEPRSAPAWQLRAEALARLWRWDAALEASDRALALDAGRAFAYAQRASMMVLLGRPAEALGLVDRALQLTEQRPGYALFQRCRALMATGVYRDAIDACRKSIVHEEWWLQHAYLLAAYTRVGDRPNAQLERDELYRGCHGCTIARIRAMQLSNADAYLQQTDAHLFRGLRDAGVAEGR